MAVARVSDDLVVLGASVRCRRRRRRRLGRRHRSGGRCEEVADGSCASAARGLGVEGHLSGEGVVNNLEFVEMDLFLEYQSDRNCEGDSLAELHS